MPNLAPVPPEPESLQPSSYADDLLEILGRTDLVANGQALLISIAPVKTALGSRWGTRQTQIYDLVERYFRKYLQPDDLCQKVAETCFLIGTPGRSRLIAQAICYRALKDVLSFFLGDVYPKDLEINLIMALSPGRVDARQCSIAELDEAEEHARHEDARRASKEEPASALTNLTSWPLVTPDGLDLRVSFAVDPVLDLKAQAVAGHRIESRIINQRTGVELTTEQRRKLLPRDLERIDLAALERAISRLSAHSGGSRPTLIVQLSFASLSNSRSRRILVDRAHELGDRLKRGAICELVDLETGLPGGRLAEVASLVRPMFRGVWAQVRPNRWLVDAAREAGVSGMTARADEMGQDNAAIMSGMSRFMTLAGPTPPCCVVTGLPANELIIAAGEIGVSHATVRAPR